jgi:hypothetical protein
MGLRGSVAFRLNVKRIEARLVAVEECVDTAVVAAANAAGKVAAIDAMSNQPAPRRSRRSIVVKRFGATQ